MKNYLLWWYHKLRRNYYRSMAESCLDKAEKTRLWELYFKHDGKALHYLINYLTNKERKNK